jgi:hypothetical protein
MKLFIRGMLNSGFAASALAVVWHTYRELTSHYFATIGLHPDFFGIGAMLALLAFPLGVGVFVSYRALRWVYSSPGKGV